MTGRTSQKWLKEQKDGKYPKISAFFGPTPTQPQIPTNNASINPPVLNLVPNTTPEKKEIHLTSSELLNEELSQTLDSDFESQEIIGFTTLSQSSDGSISDGEDLLPWAVTFKPRPKLTRLHRWDDPTSEVECTNQMNTNWITRVIDKLKQHSNPIDSTELHPFKTLAAQWVSTGEHFKQKNGICGLCDHHPITFHFKVANIHNHNQLWIGSECIRKFSEENLGLQQDEIILYGVEAEKQIKKNISTIQQDAEAAKKELRRFTMR